MSRKDRIELQWFPPFFKALRGGRTLDTRHASLNFHERSHFLGMLHKAGLIEIVAVKPITQIRGTDKFFVKDKQGIVISFLKNALKSKEIFETPVKKMQNEIVDWTKKRDGTPIIRYSSLSTFTFEQDADFELKRTKHQAEVSRRPGQPKFSMTIRNNYRGRCAVTGCETSAVLQAAHVRTISGKDFNAPNNGILLRSDIHALLDAFLISFNEAGTNLEASHTLKDKTYNLSGAKVVAPTIGPRISPENIKYHRKRFAKEEEKRKLEKK